MKTNKYLTTQITFLLFCLIPIFRCQELLAQDWNYQMGFNSPHFSYQNPTGQDLNSFQPNPGFHLSILRNAPLVDSSKTKHALLRRLEYQYGLSLTQFNSSGVNQFIPFSYTSTYVGIKLGIGINSRLGRGYTFHYGTTLQLNKLIMGSQHMGNLIYNLQGNNQFDQMQWHWGGEIKLAKKINAQTALYFFLADVWQLNSSLDDGSHFSINPTTFGFGIQFSSQN